MKTITIKTATLFEKGHFTSSTISKDYARQGWIDVTFGVTDKFIRPVSVCGLEISGNIKYVKNAKSVLEIRNNKSFFKRYIADLEPVNVGILENIFKNKFVD